MLHKYIILLSLSLVRLFVFSQHTTDSLITHYQQKVKYLAKSAALAGFYSIDKTGIKVFSSPQNKNAAIAEWELSWEEMKSVDVLFQAYPFDSLMNDFGTLKKSLPLQKVVMQNAGLTGKKIVIDPGHTAGNFEMAQIESRYLKVVTDTQTYQLSEGMMTFKVAQILRKKLELQGATVVFTRDSMGHTAFRETYMNWYDRNKQKRGAASTPKKTFTDYFRDYELAKRAVNINVANADIAVIIHFNVNEKNAGWSKTTDKNFNMAFVGGNFVGGNLSSRKARFEFFRMLVTSDWERSVKLSSYCVQEFKKQLNVPIAKTADADYLQDKSIATYTEGVFARNLYLTRTVHVPLVYGETLYQDNHQEIKRLFFDQDKRLEQVAEAYYQGILKYFSE